LHNNNNLNGTKRGVFATIEATTSSNDPQAEVPYEPKWREVSREGIKKLGKVVRMMYANSVGA